jgi:hypothetical protein
LFSLLYVLDMTSDSLWRFTVPLDYLPSIVEWYRMCISSVYLMLARIASWDYWQVRSRIRIRNMSLLYRLGLHTGQYKHVLKREPMKSMVQYRSSTERENVQHDDDMLPKLVTLPHCRCFQKTMCHARMPRGRPWLVSRTR